MPPVKTIVPQEMDKALFERGSKIDVRGKTKQKQGLTYLSWASAWAEFKKAFPLGYAKVLPQTIVVNDRTAYRPWHDDGKYGWVEVEVGVEFDTKDENGDPDYTSLIEWLPILDFKNKAIPAENITSLEANKAYKRCLVKAIAMLTGIGLYVYEGEDMPEEVERVQTLQKECVELVKKKCTTKEATEKVGELCRTTLPEECNGNPMYCEDSETLLKLKRSLMAIRVAKKKEE